MSPLTRHPVTSPIYQRLPPPIPTRAGDQTFPYYGLANPSQPLASLGLLQSPTSAFAPQPDPNVINDGITDLADDIGRSFVNGATS